MPDRMTTPLPPTPNGPTKTDNTPRFARDTAASRNAREQRLGGTRSRGEGPIAPVARPVSWQAQVAARSPQTSPTTLRKKGTGQKPQLIRQMTQPYTQSKTSMLHVSSLSLTPMQPKKAWSITPTCNVGKAMRMFLFPFPSLTIPPRLLL